MNVAGVESKSPLFSSPLTSASRQTIWFASLPSHIPFASVDTAASMALYAGATLTVPPPALGLDAIGALSNARAQLVGTYDTMAADNWWLSLYNLFEIYRLTPGSWLQIKLLVLVGALLYYSTPYFTRLSALFIVWLFGERNLREFYSQVTSAVILRWYLVLKMASAVGLGIILAIFYYYSTYVWSNAVKLEIQSSYYGAIVFSMWTLLKLWPVFLTSAATREPVSTPLRWRRWLQLVMVVHSSKLQLPLLLAQWSFWAVLASAFDVLSILFEKRTLRGPHTTIPITPGTVNVPVISTKQTTAEADAIATQSQQAIFGQGVYPILYGLTSATIFFELLCSLYDSYNFFVLVTAVGWGTLWPLVITNSGILVSILFGEYGYRLSDIVYEKAIARYAALNSTPDSEIADEADRALEQQNQIDSLPTLAVAEVVTSAVGREYYPPKYLQVDSAALSARCRSLTPNQMAAAIYGIRSALSRVVDGPRLMQLQRAAHTAQAILAHIEAATVNDLVTLYRQNLTASQLVSSNFTTIRSVLDDTQLCILKSWNDSVREAIRLLMVRFPTVDTSQLTPMDL